MTFKEEIRRIRGDRSRTKMHDLYGISHETWGAWERGERVPLPVSINKLARIFGWNDEKRMSFMPEPKGKEELSRRLERHMQFLGLSDAQAGILFGVNKSTVLYWKNKRVPKGNRTLVFNFLQMNKEEVDSLLAYNERVLHKKPTQKKRVEINYDLIYKIERKYGSLAKAKDDDPMLEVLQREMNGVGK